MIAVGSLCVGGGAGLVGVGDFVVEECVLEVGGVVEFADKVVLY